MESFESKILLSLRETIRFLIDYVNVTGKSDSLDFYAKISETDQVKITIYAEPYDTEREVYLRTLRNIDLTGMLSRERELAERTSEDEIQKMHERLVESWMRQVAQIVALQKDKTDLIQSRDGAWKILEERNRKISSLEAENRLLKAKISDVSDIAKTNLDLCERLLKVSSHKEE